MRKLISEVVASETSDGGRNSWGGSIVTGCRSKDKIGLYPYWHVRTSVGVKISRRLSGLSRFRGAARLAGYSRRQGYHNTANWTQSSTARSQADRSLSRKVLHSTRRSWCYSYNFDCMPQHWSFRAPMMMINALVRTTIRREKCLIDIFNGFVFSILNYRRVM